MTRLAAFIMTYERPEILLGTIRAIQEQTCPPEKILIVDNSITHTTEELIKSSPLSNVEYYRVGYNSGPAGASRIGLQHLAQEGYDWIYWGDDNDPPKSAECFDMLLRQVHLLNNVGIVGAVGHTFNWATIEVERTTDDVLAQTDPWLSVDIIAGGMCMLVNTQVISAGIVPDSDLFYGFEELDFCLNVKRGGFSIYVQKDLFRFYRKNSKRPLDRAGKKGLRKNEKSLWRSYYSTRNMLIILHKHNKRMAKLYYMIRSVVSAFYYFKYGIGYGLSILRYRTIGIIHFLKGTQGKMPV